MSNKITKKETTLDDLAVMVAEGFQGVNGRLDKVEQDVGELKQDVGQLRQGVGELKHEMSALHASVNNYLELSDKRYLELKARQNLIVSWVKTIADKTGVKIDIKELEKIG